MQNTPTKEELVTALADADEATEKSAALRKRLRRRRTTKRSEELADMREACAEVAKPLRRYIGMSVQHDFSDKLDVRLKKAMAALRKERELLRKML